MWAGGTVSGLYLPPFCRQVQTRTSVLLRVGDMSDARAFRQSKGGATVGKWVVCAVCAGRRSSPTAVCETCADSDLCLLLGLRNPNWAALFRYHISSGLESGNHREGAVDEHKNRCDPRMLTCAQGWLTMDG